MWQFSAIQRRFDFVKDRMSRHIPELDGLRGLAILYVFFHNVGTHGLGETESFVVKIYSLIADIGWIGVQLFFVLSGFLITGILLEKQCSKDVYKNFYVRRVLRIFPVYYVSLIILFVLPEAANWDVPWAEKSSDYQIWYWLYAINWIQPLTTGLEIGHLWSLAIEEQFYLIWPLLVAGLTRRQFFSST